MRLMYLWLSYRKPVLDLSISCEQNTNFVFSWRFLFDVFFKASPIRTGWYIRHSYMQLELANAWQCT